MTFEYEVKATDQYGLELHVVTVVEEDERLAITTAKLYASAELMKKGIVAVRIEELV